MGFGGYRGGSKPQTGKISDRAISRILNIPLQTLNDWKKQNPENWRVQLYRILKSCTEQELIEKKEQIF